MPTRASVRMKDYDGEWYSYTVDCDGYPSGITKRIPTGKPTYEKLRRALSAQDYYDVGVEYIYEIDVEGRTVSVYEAIYIPEEHIKNERFISYKSARFEKGDKLFEGTFDEARDKF